MYNKPQYRFQVVAVFLTLFHKLDSMGWFSHRRRSGGRHNCITYLRAPKDCSPQKNSERGPRPRGRLPNKMPHFVLFCSRWPCISYTTLRDSPKFTIYPYQ